MTTLSIIFQSVNENKKMIIYLTIGLIVKFVLNVPLMYIFHNFGIHASYGVSTATIIGCAISCILILISLGKRLKVNYEPTLRKLLDIILSTFVMAIVILLLQLVIPVDTHNRLLALLLTLMYTIIGGSIYLFITMKNGMFYEIWGRNFIKKILIKLRLKKPDAEPITEE
jgi:peptidoglycan biosynthesis protein MviN/MurJ (putative lipid II flippase)